MNASALLKAIPWRVQLAFILAGYAAVAVYGATEVYLRELAARRDPVYSSGGMWAWGDEMLAWYIFFLFLAPTFLLLWLMRQYEHTYTIFSRVAFWVSVSAPVCLGILYLGAVFPSLKSVTDPVVWRTWRAPFVLIVMGLSRIMAPRVDAARRLLTRSLLIEGGTLAISVALLLAAR